MVNWLKNNNNCHCKIIVLFDFLVSVKTCGLDTFEIGSQEAMNHKCFGAWKKKFQTVMSNYYFKKKRLKAKMKNTANSAQGRYPLNKEHK